MFSLQEFYRLRTNALVQLKNSGFDPYPHKFHVSRSLEDYIDTYNSLKESEVLNDVEESVAGESPISHRR